MDDKKTQQMRIGFFGNTNNYPFLIARAMRDLGHQVVFLVNRPELLHRPEGRFGQYKNGYPDWIVDLSGLLVPIVTQQGREEVLGRLNECDLAVLNGDGIGIGGGYGLKVPHVALMTGSDLTYLAHWHTVWAMGRSMRSSGPFRHIKQIKRYWEAWLVVNHQRRAIRRARVYSYFPKGLLKADEAILRTIRPRGRRLFFPLADTHDISYAPPPHNRPVVLLNGARISWVKPKSGPYTELDYKGTDILIKGVALYLKKKPGAALEVRLVKKGKDVAATQALVAKLGIESHVVWLEEMTSGEIMEAYKQADIVAENLAMSAPGMVTMDAMTLGRPVITNAHPEYFAPVFGKPYPVGQAATPEEVCSWLEKWVEHPTEREKIGLEARAFALDHFFPRRAAEKLLEAAFSQKG